MATAIHRFWITRIGDSGVQIVVPYTLSGTAVNGTDYVYYDTTSKSQAQPLGNTGTITVSSGSFPGSSLALIKYAPSNHPEKTITTTFTAPAGYNRVGSNVLTGRILQQNISDVSITPINSTTLARGNTKQGFTLTRSSGNTAQPLLVNYQIGGTGTNGTDYGYLSGTATIPANQTSLNIPITVPTPSSPTAQKDVLLTLATPTDNSYNVSSSNSQDFTIPAYNPSTISFAQGSGGGTLTPGQSQPFTVTRAGGDTSQPLTVNYTTGGSAQPGSDYQPLSGSVTIPAGQMSASVPLSAIKHTDNTAVPQKDLTITPAAGTDYDASGAQPIAYTIPAYTPATVSVSQPTNGGAIPAGGSAPFTVTRTGDTSQPLTIPYTTGGTAASPGDYNQLPGSITIPAGQSSATQTITTPTQNGSTAQPSKTITLTPQSGNGYTLDPNSGTATYTTAAYTPSAVSAAPGSGGSTIPQGTTGGFTLTRTGSTTAALPVTYSLGGTAQNGTDYNQLPGQVTIPAGQSSVTVPVTVPANTGSTATPAKAIKVTVASGSGYAPDSQSPSTDLTIPAYSPNSVSFNETGGTLTPGGMSDRFTVTRTGDNSKALPVAIGAAGSAQPGLDYGQLPSSVTIPAGQSSVTVPLRAFPQSGTAAQPQKDVQISLKPGAGYAPSSTTPIDYTIPAYSPNTSGNPAVTVSLPTGQDTILTPGTSTDGFTVTRSGTTTSPLTVNYGVGGTAQSGTDYTPLSGTVTIPAGATSATVPIAVPSGATNGKTVAINLTPGTGYDQGTNSDVTYTISEPNATGPKVTLPVISVGFDASLPAFTVTRSGDPSQPLTVPVDFGGTGVAGVDYSQLPNSVRFPSGSSTVSIPVKLLPTATTGNTITASIPSGSGYTVGAGNGTSFSVPDGYGKTGSGSTGTGTGSTVASSATGKKKKGGGLSGVGFVTAVGAVGGTIAASTGAFGAGAAATGAGGLAVPGLLAGSVFGTIPQSCATTGETSTELVKLIPQLKDGNPDWNGMTFGTLPAPTQAGSLKFGNVSRDWKAGQPVADIVHLGDTDGSFNLHCLGLSKLASLGQMGMAQKPLSTLNLVADTSVQGLSKTLYLRAKKVGDVKGMAEWLASKSGGKVTATQLSGMSFAEMTKAQPSLGGLQMGPMPLNQLPGYSDILLGDIPNWASKSVSQVVGLQQVPFSQFPSQPKPVNALNK